MILPYTIISRSFDVPPRKRKKEKKRLLLSLGKNLAGDTHESSPPPLFHLPSSLAFSPFLTHALFSPRSLQTPPPPLLHPSLSYSSSSSSSLLPISAAPSKRRQTSTSQKPPQRSTRPATASGCATPSARSIPPTRYLPAEPIPPRTAAVSGGGARLARTSCGGISFLGRRRGSFGCKEEKEKGRERDKTDKSANGHAGCDRRDRARSYVARETSSGGEKREEKGG